MLRLYDTARREVRTLAQRDAGKVSIYLCGPTVYAPPHLGHGRQNVVYDVLVRYLRWRGLEVRLVSNVTDIDDQIIDRAQREQRPWQDITARCERVWFDAQARLGAARPDDTPHATEYVEDMVALVGELVDRGVAYETGDGVYLSVETVPDYGLLAHQSLADLRAGGGERDVVGAGGKRHPADFVLWKLAKPGEPAWPSPWGDGRPGWHTECVVMALDLLGEGFDLHGGGQDLRFPHHENERAQAVALGKRFANHWMHHAFVVDAEGEKMSKSLGNVDNLLDLLDRYDERTYRLLLLQSHYRSPVSVGVANLEAAEKGLAHLDAFAARTAVASGGSSGSSGSSGSTGATGATGADPDVLDAFVAAMDDDLDTPKALALVFDTVRRANAGLDAGADVSRLVAAVREMAAAVGLELHGGAEVPPDAATRAAELDAARARKDYAAADAIRAQLQADGWMVETTAAGTTLRR